MNNTTALLDFEAKNESTVACPCKQHTPVSVSVAQGANTDVYFDSCEDIKCVNLGDNIISDQGRILDVTAMLRHVCPGKRVAVGVTLYEMDPSGAVHPRGIKTVLVPAQTGTACVDVQLPSMRFIMPEEEDDSVATVTNMCNNTRHFTIRVDAHYADITGTCCS